MTAHDTVARQMWDITHGIVMLLVCGGTTPGRLLSELANVVPAQVYDAKKNMNIHVAASSIVTSSY